MHDLHDGAVVQAGIRRGNHREQRRIKRQLRVHGQEATQQELAADGRRKWSDSVRASPLSRSKDLVKQAEVRPSAQ